MTNLHSASAPVFEHQLANIGHWLDKAAAHAQARRFDSAKYLTMTLAPDMLDFGAQVRIAGEIAKMAVSRLANLDAPKSIDAAPTLANLAEHLAHTREFISSVDPKRMEGGDTREIVLPQRSGGPLHFTGETFLLRWALPNVFFHATTAYALLRKAGVELGKADFLGL